MKGILLVLVVSNLSIISFAQITRNNWLVGGNGKFYSYTSSYTSNTYSNKAKFTDIDISANIGYFVANKLAFGLRPTFSSSKGKVTTPGGLRTNTRRYSAGPFARFYFLDVGKPYNLLADVGYQHGITTLDNKKIGSFKNFSALAGPAIYFNNCIAIEFLLGYNSSIEEKDESYKEKNEGFQVNIGFQIHLER